MHRNVRGPFKALAIDGAVGIQEGCHRHQHVTVVGRVERRFLLIENTDDLVLTTIEADVAADRVHKRIQALSDAVTQNNDLASGAHVHLRDIASPAHEVGVVLRVFGRAADDRDVVVGLFALVLGLETELPDLGADDVDGLDVIADGLRVSKRQRRPAHRFATILVCGESCRPLLDLERLRAEHTHFLFHRALHDRDAGHDRNDRGNAENDADQGQRRAQLVGANRLQ